MDKQRILALAEALEAGDCPDHDGAPVGFNMWHLAPHDTKDLTGKGCDTACCLAGWAALKFDGEIYEETVEARARALLGLTIKDADLLFYPPIGNSYYCSAPADAARVLRHLANTGEVDWSKARSTP